MGTTDSDDDNLLALICDRVNQKIESMTLQPVCPIASDTYTYDVDVANLRNLYLPMPVDAATKAIGGAREVTVFEVAPVTGGTYEDITADILLRSRQGVTGPYRWARITDKPTGSFRTFPKGAAVARVTMTAGWDAIPDDLTATALLIAQRMWNAKNTGNQDAVGGDDVARFMDRDDLRVIRSYKARPVP